MIFAVLVALLDGSLIIGGFGPPQLAGADVSAVSCTVTGSVAPDATSPYADGALTLSCTGVNTAQLDVVFETAGNTYFMDVETAAAEAAAGGPYTSLPSSLTCSGVNDSAADEWTVFGGCDYMEVAGVPDADASSAFAGFDVGSVGSYSLADETMDPGYGTPADGVVTFAGTGMDSSSVGFPVGLTAEGFFMVGLGFLFGSMLGWLPRLWR